MINKLKTTLTNNFIVIKNFGYITILKSFNIFIPLITLPHLIGTLGPDLYGKVIYAQSVIMFLSILINFGFNISGTKNISLSRNDKSKLREIVFSIYFIKLFLFLISFVILFILVVTIDHLRDMRLLLLLSFLSAFNEFLFPIWYFQGLDKMKFITIINIIGKILFTVLIFILIKEPEDYLYVPLTYGLSFLLNGLVSLYIIVYKEKVHFSKPNISKIKFYFKESLPLFISQSSIQIYVNANKFLIGSFIGMTQVAFYDLAEKILNFIKVPVNMLLQAVFPTLTLNKNIKQINNYMFLGLLLTSILVCITMIFTEDIIMLIGSSLMIEATNIIRILILSSIFVAISQFLGTGRLIVFGFTKTFSLIITSSALFFGISFLILFYNNKISLNSLVWLAVGVELWVTFLMLVFNLKHKILFNEKI